MAENAPRDGNRVAGIILKANDGSGLFSWWVDPSTHRALVTATISGGVTIPASSLSTAVAVQIVDGSGNQITSFGGGSQYAENATTSPATGSALLGRFLTVAPSLTNGQMQMLQLDSSGNLKVTGSLSVGGTTDNSAYTAGSGTGTPAMGFYHSTIDAVTDGRAATIGMTSKRAMLVNLQSSAGSELLGQQAMAASIPVVLASNQTSIPVAATLSAETTKVIGTVNIAAAQTIAVTNAGTFATQDTLAAETTKVIGTVRTADGSGNLYTSNSTTFTAKNAQDTNLLGTLGTAFSTAGKVDVKGADGDVFVRQATGTNLHTVLDSGTLTSLTQFNGVAITLNKGASDTGTLRVSLGDGTQTIGSLAANQSVNVAQMNGVATSMGAGATGTGTQRVVIANDAGKTLTSASGTAASNGNNTLVAAGTNKLKVYAFSLSTVSTASITAIFQSGAGGTELWRVVLQAISGAAMGANLSVSPPAWLFATGSATLLNLNLSSANTVHWSAAYYDEA